MPGNRPVGPPTLLRIQVCRERVISFIFITRLGPEGTALWYSTVLGGTLPLEGTTGDKRSGLDLGPEGEAVAGGFTKATDFPKTPRAFDGTANGMQDGFVVILDMLPVGVEKYGPGTAACAETPWAAVTAQPVVGGAFGITCTGAKAPAAPALLLLGSAALASPVTAKGTQVWVSPFALHLLLPVVRNAMGFTLVPAALPNDPFLTGLTVHAQFFFGRSSCVSAGWSASQALAITIQP